MNDEFVLKIEDVVQPVALTDKQIKYINGVSYDYEIFPLLDQYDESLRQRPQPFYFKDDDKNSRTPIQSRYLAVSLIETMRHNYGLGLAANQCGVPYRVFVMGSEGTGFAFFNPEIVATEGDTLFEEGCLSFPGLFLPVRRPESVTIKYQDMNGEQQEKTFSGLSARIVLHEYDHMEGIVFTSKVSPIKLEQGKRKVKHNLKVLERQRIHEEKQELIRKAMERLALDAKKKVTADQALGVSN